MNAVIKHTMGAVILAIKTATWPFICTAVVLIGFSWPAPSPAGDLYKWVDDNGVVHFSDAVPPEAIDKKRDVLDNKGIVVNEIEAKKTKAQLEEEERRKQVEAEKQHEINAQQQYDHMLLDTYTSESDIVSMRDRKISAIADIITLNQNRIDKLKEDLAPLKKQVETLRKNGQDIPADLSAHVKDLEDHITVRINIIEKTRADEAHWRKQFAQDLERYRYLTAQQNPPSEALSSGSTSPPPHP
jgi:hypothetical protein